MHCKFSSLFNKFGKPVGQVFKHEIKEVIPSTKYHKGAAHCFEVHHSGSGTPWILSASTQVSVKVVVLG